MKNYNLKTVFIYFFIGLLLFCELLLLKYTDARIFLLPILLADVLLFLGMAIYKPALCLNVAIMLLPFKNILFTYEMAGITLDVYTAAILGLFPVCLIKIVFSHPRFKVLFSDILAILFCIFSLSFFLTSNDYLKCGFVYFHSVLIPFISYFLIRYIVTSKARYESLRLHFIVSVCFLAIFSIAYFVVTSGARLTVAGDNALKSAGFFALVFFLIDSKGVFEFLKKRSLFLIAFTFCLSRMYILNMLLSPIYFFFYKRGKSRQLLISIIVATLFFTLLTAIMFNPVKYHGVQRQFYAEPLAERVQIENSSARFYNSTHLQMSFYGLAGMWKFELQRFFASPLWGGGMGNTSLQSVASSHNLHIQLLSYVGVIGWLIFHAFMLSICASKRIIIQNGKLSRDLLACLVFVIIIYNNGLTNGLFHGDFNYLFLIVLGLIQCLTLFEKNEYQTT